MDLVQTDENLIIEEENKKAKQAFLFAEIFAQSYNVDQFLNFISSKKQNGN